MNKNQKSMVFLGFIFVMVIGMVVLYENFLHDKPMIEKQQQEALQQNLTPDQMINGIKSFVNTTTNNIKAPPLGTTP